ncbi:MAG TPA: DUF4239 domain-containing protein [Pseudomonadales bacterium]
MYLYALLLVLGLFLAVFGCLHLGRSLGRRRLLSDATAHEGLGAVDGAVFGMMGLLLAFTFTGAASRFDDRRDMIVSEVNAIGTAWLRLDVLQEKPRDEMRSLFREYLDGRIAVYRQVTLEDFHPHARIHVAVLQQRLWDGLQAALKDDGRPTLLNFVLPPVNDMFDIAEARYRATQQHPPIAIYLLLGLLVLVAALLAGFGMAKTQRQSLLHMIGFAAVTAIAVYLIIDLEYPRFGIVRVDEFDQALLDLRASMDTGSIVEGR